ncbi:glycosyltransferase [Brucella lupini]|uniref:Glycosyl transferases group 1 family protein n=1 Tax=Brucella lupini TaxID=255457 RepID=A0A256H1G1_9HYPH|nr:glycosyltransferase [Brucella lupini]KAB2702061.1 glycosyltransferase [Brucella lupini]OYR32936.1 glycosyl transferases group 1 family protein [Brucella lupini]
MKFTLAPGVQSLSYTSSSSHAYLSTDFLDVNGPNIGINGCNLTITFLALNRSYLTERLCQSISEHIPNFSGEVLAIDNGSDPDELLKLQEILKCLPCKNRLVSLGQNFGVAGGRNRTIEHVRTDWLMCLDNDIYFTTNPLEKVQRDLAILGCKFANLPLLEPDGETIFSFGGHLYVHFDDQQNLRLGHGGAYAISKPSVQEADPQLSTFLFGGSSVFEKNSFKALGGYDENMFVGFEDTDFSIRLFQAGIKVGTVGTFSLIHEHPMRTDEDARRYRMERYSPSAIEHSAKYMEKKHSFNFWNDDLEDWVRSKHDMMEQQETTLEKDIKKLPKIALVADTDNWAFANIARQIKKSLGSKYDIDILYFSDFDGFFQLLLVLEGYDLVHFFWRQILGGLCWGFEKQRAELAGVTEYYSSLQDKFDGIAITTAVYDHLFLDDKSIERYEEVFSLVDGYSVSSKILHDIYSSIASFPNPTATLQDGVDLSHFIPIRTERFTSNLDRPLVIGWAGNSAWRPDEDGIDYKGLHTIIRPALSILASKGIDYIENFADKQIIFRSYDEMPDYYSSIDVYVCGSLIEGTPNPILEAMACGVPIVSTNVGIVSEAFGPEQKKFILRERTPEAMAEALLNLSSDRSMLQRLANENLTYIKAWDWSKKAKDFDQLFEKALFKKNNQLGQK